MTVTHSEQNLYTDSGYWEIVLLYRSKVLRTFITSSDLESYPPEHYQVLMCRILAGLDNVLNSYDAVLILEHNVSL